MTDWHVGMRVICVRFKGRGGYGDENNPTIGHVYTIREIVFRHCQDSREICFLLEEVKNEQRPYREGYCEVGFRSICFRPLRETTTDISIFRKLVEPSELAKFKEGVEA